MNALAERGHNRPPSHLEMTHDVIEALAVWLDQVPVVQSHEEAKVAAELIKRASIASKELDAERDGLVRPLNAQVKQINGEYKVVSDPLARCANEIKQRMIAFLRAAEARKAAEAAAARDAALAAEKAAREAAEREREAIENATLGELGSGVGEAIQEAAEAEAAAAKAAHAAAIATKDIPARISTGYGRAVAMRTVETLAIDNHISAIVTLWPNDRIAEAILSASREYRRLHDKLPKGISVHTERKI